MTRLQCLWLGMWLNLSIAAAQPLQLAMANPAAVACASAGGISLKTYDSKGEHGMCKLPSGQICEEWAFFKGDCTPSDDANTRTQAVSTDPTTATDKARK
jgi:putative hemolysin